MRSRLEEGAKVKLKQIAGVKIIVDPDYSTLRKHYQTTYDASYKKVMVGTPIIATRKDVVKIDKKKPSRAK
jgi:hypothetical protein